MLTVLLYDKNVSMTRVLSFLFHPVYQETGYSPVQPDAQIR